MNEQYRPRPLDPWDNDRDHLPAVTDPGAPTEWFPAAQFPTERFPAAHWDPQRSPADRFRDPPATRPAEPLAHEGGLAYGNPPAAPYRAPEEFIPRHLAMSPFGAGPYPQHHLPQPFMPQPFMHQPFMHHPYPQLQQTVFVTNGGGRRVNHALHLILTVLSFGLWLPVWAVLAIANS